MKPETLEQLIIDEQLGELSADVKEMVTAYNKLNPTAAATEMDIKRLLVSIRTTFAESGADEIGPLPPPSFLDRAVVQRHYAWGRRWPKGLTLAACLFLAFGLGRFLQPETVGGPAFNRSSIESYVSAPNEVDQFWSLSRLQKIKPRESAATRQVLEWSSPLTPPTIGEKL